MRKPRSDTVVFFIILGAIVAFFVTMIRVAGQGVQEAEVRRSQEYVECLKKTSDLHWCSDVILDIKLPREGEKEKDA